MNLPSSPSIASTLNHHLSSPNFCGVLKMNKLYHTNPHPISFKSQASLHPFSVFPFIICSSGLNAQLFPRTRELSMIPTLYYSRFTRIVLQSHRAKRHETQQLQSPSNCPEYGLLKSLSHLNCIAKLHGFDVHLKVRKIHLTL